MLNGLMRNNGWLPTVFDDFFNTDFMPRANSTAPAVNVKESETAYIMELAAPGIKKEYCRVAINDEGNLTIAIENKQEHKQEDKHHHYLRREFSYSNYEQSYTLPDDVVKDEAEGHQGHRGLISLDRLCQKGLKHLKTVGSSIHRGVAPFIYFANLSNSA